jgi:hypothetical protein
METAQFSPDQLMIMFTDDHFCGGIVSHGSFPRNFSVNLIESFCSSSSVKKLAAPKCSGCADLVSNAINQRFSTRVEYTRSLTLV